MESWFGGIDFGAVRIHTDSAGAASAKSLNANAYTVGNHIVFNSSMYSPSTTEGQRLIAHELFHTRQQPQGASPGGELKLEDPGSAAEHEAEAAASAFPAGGVQPLAPVHSAEGVARDIIGPTKSLECKETGRSYLSDNYVVQQDYKISVNSNSAIEYSIPGSSAEGRLGFADIVDLDGPEIYEVKAPGDDLAAASRQLLRYLYYSRNNCPGFEDVAPGEGYPSGRQIQGVNPDEQLVVEQVAPGILVYNKRRQRQPQEQEVHVPATESLDEKQRETVKQRIISGLEAAGVAAAYIVAAAAAIALIFAAGVVLAAVASALAAELIAVGIAAAIVLLVLREAGVPAPNEQASNDQNTTGGEAEA